MFRRPLRFTILPLLVLATCAIAGNVWLDRPPINTDAAFVGISGEATFGIGQAYRWLGYILNAPVLAGILYLLARHEVDWSHYLEVYVGILIGSFILGIMLAPALRIFAVLPILAFVAILLAQFCSVRPRHAVAASFLYQLYQIGFILICRAAI